MRSTSQAAAAAYQLTFTLDDPAPLAPGLGWLQQLADAIAATHAPGITLRPLKISGHMRRTLGSFHPASHEIRFNARLLHLGAEEDIRKVLVHELAHAIAHHRAPGSPAHGRLFRQVCRELGAAPSRYVDVAVRRWREQTRYAARCRRCSSEVIRSRRIACARCACGQLVAPSRWHVVAIKDTGERTVIGTSAPPSRSRQARARPV